MTNALLIVLSVLAAETAAEPSGTEPIDGETTGPAKDRAVQAAEKPPRLKCGEQLSIMQARLDIAREQELAAGRRENSCLQQLGDKNAIVGFTNEKLVRAEVEAKALRDEVKKLEESAKTRDQQTASMLVTQMVLGAVLFFSAIVNILALIYGIRSYRLQKRGKAPN
jgi:hypothetical protein